MLSPSPKTWVPFVSRKLLLVMLRGWNTALCAMSPKSFSLPCLAVVFVRAKDRSWNAALEMIGVVSGKKRGGTREKVFMKAA